MRRYKVSALVQQTSGEMKRIAETIISTNPDTARSRFARMHVVSTPVSVEDVTDADTGWMHVAFVQSRTEPDVVHELRRNRTTNVIACGCKAFQFSRGNKTCNHLRALQIGDTAPVMRIEKKNGELEQHVSVTWEKKTTEFTVVRRAISIGPLKAKEQV